MYPALSWGSLTPSRPPLDPLSGPRGPRGYIRHKALNALLNVFLRAGEHGAGARAGLEVGVVGAAVGRDKAQHAAAARAQDDGEGGPGAGRLPHLQVQAPQAPAVRGALKRVE
eukprot:5254461-Pyramimonas_sp.AAC.1